MNPNECAQSLKYDVVRDSEWSRHPVLHRINRGTDVWPNEWHFYLANFSPTQSSQLKRIELATAVVGSSDFVWVEQVAPAREVLFDEPAQVRWYFVDPLRDAREWVALVPRGFDLNGDAEDGGSEPDAVVTDPDAGTLSNRDRVAFLRRHGCADDPISLALGNLKWSDALILSTIAGRIAP
jgi:hypothetical protein